ncbi:hypothetical protein L1987_48625 [Smallanthus sonchifolius]|uniref:Uncharacterized protein n=1 Tax=Smallanthus sonchifolius TaxID=185202 RepID=A0ACB9FSI2_9ASTR|nr:hypothetical protein L1987_48625 [Smallanthus sonchifolius]
MGRGKLMNFNSYSKFEFHAPKSLINQCRFIFKITYLNQIIVTDRVPFLLLLEAAMHQLYVLIARGRGRPLVTIGENANVNIETENNYKEQFK